jgi:hypothetical protein
MFDNFTTLIVLDHEDPLEANHPMLWWQLYKAPSAILFN